MIVHRLTVYDPAGRIVNYFAKQVDAERTFRDTYSKVDDKPKHEIEPVDILEQSTHL